MYKGLFALSVLTLSILINFNLEDLNTGQAHAQIKRDVTNVIHQPSVQSIIIF